MMADKPENIVFGSLRTDQQVQEAITQMHARYFDEFDKCRAHGIEDCHDCAREAGGELAALFDDSRKR